MFSWQTYRLCRTRESIGLAADSANLLCNFEQAMNSDVHSYSKSSYNFPLKNFSQLYGNPVYPRQLLKKQITFTVALFEQTLSKFAF